MRRVLAAFILLFGLVGFMGPAQAKWNTPPEHEPPPPGGKLGLVESMQAAEEVPENIGPGRRGLPLPGNSGTGRRAVYSISAQHVWIVEGNGKVIRDYPVSGRRGLPAPGTYSVFSRSRVSSSGTLKLNYMVRFARGRSLAIGFHEIPIRPNGTYIQSLSQLGTPLSHGCVRQAAVDAAFMWDWGQIGTKVVVLG